MLRSGDRLPTVKEVVGALAINPNTVLKAYRELEHEGLVEGRPGLGTFVRDKVGGPPPNNHAAIRRGLDRWLEGAFAAGLDAEDVRALFETSLHAARDEGAVSTALNAIGLSKRYGKHWALRDCGFEVRRGRVVGLVGPNGAGKTTLLHLAAGLLRPTAGTVSVFGGTPGRDTEVLPDIGFMAQDVPLYRSFTVGQMFGFARHTNARWDADMAVARLDRTGVDLGQRVGTLSGGQRAQVGLSLALAKRPRLLLLDEPLASLDPLARREFLRALMEGVVDGELTVVLSSHLIADLERVCDYLIVLSASHTQVAGDIASLLDSHRVLTGPRRDGAEVPGVAAIIQRDDTDRQTTMLVRTEEPILDPSWSVHQVDLEELVLAYLGQPSARTLPPPRLAQDRSEVS